MNEVVRCPYCNELASLRPTRVSKGIRFDAKWVCEPCDAYCPVGGTMANGVLRAMRIQLHKVFDCHWKFTHRSRSACYAALAEAMDITKAECHIGRFSIEQCEEAYGIILTKVWLP